jgi:hypothetical protein
MLSRYTVTCLVLLVSNKLGSETIHTSFSPELAVTIPATVLFTFRGTLMHKERGMLRGVEEDRQHAAFSSFSYFSTLEQSYEILEF